MDRDDVQGRIEASLARIGAATEELLADPRITDAVVEAAQRASTAVDPLAGIARATGSIDAGDALSAAVMARVEGAEVGAPAAAPSWLDGVARTGPAAIGIAALAAAASFLLFLASERDVNAALAASIDTVEVSE